MNMGFLVILLFSSGLLSFMLAILVLKKNFSNRASISFSLLMLCVATYTLGYGLELSFSDLSDKIFWTNMQYIGIALLPAMWFVFIAQYSKKKIFLRPFFLLGYFIIPLATIILKFTDTKHQLIRDTHLITVGDISLLTFTPGIWYNIFNTYMQLSLLAGFIVLIQMYRNSSRPYRNQIKIIIAASSVPILAYSLYAFFPGFRNLDIIAPSFTITGLLAFWGIHNYKLFDLNPIAHHIIIENMNEGILITDNENNIMDVNSTMLAILNLDRPLKIIGKKIENQFPEISKEIKKTKNDESEYSWQNNGGQFFQVRSIPIDNNGGELLGQLYIFQNITERKAAEELKAKKERLQQIMVQMATDFINISIDLADSKINTALKIIGEFTGTDRAYIFMYDNRHKTLSNTFEWCAPGILPQIRTLQNQPFDKIKYTLQKHQKGEIVDVFDIKELPQPEYEFFSSQGLKSLISIPLMQDDICMGCVGFDSVKQQRQFKDEEVALLRIVAEIFKNLQLRIAKETHLKEVEEQLRFDALHDNLTHLPNRALLQNRLKQAISRNKRMPCNKFTLMFLDLDNFKNVNDLLGHEAGDKLLIEAAKRLSANLRPEDTLARLGGDEFAILLDGVSKPEQNEKTASRILSSLRQPFNITGNKVSISTSIGICPSSDDIEDPSEYLKNADMAMYRAKRSGKDRFAQYTADFFDSVIENLKERTYIGDAVSDKQLLIHYQPIVAMPSEKKIGHEAFVRWNHPEKGLLFPESFISIAEESGIIVKIGQWLIQEALSQNWEDTKTGDKSSLYLNINLSDKEFFSYESLKTVKEVLAQKKFPPDCLYLDISENVLMDVKAKSTFMEFKAIGVKIILDDFGKGFSSLDHLHTYPIDGLKIDKSFIAGLPDKKEDIAIIRTIVALGKEFNLTLTAEGVENRSQANMLKEWGVDFAQGYLWGAPQPKDNK